ncbi:hypothetical protein C8F01DRAFT_1083875 [Mycena amicta]|nr:hypothetical protein C8F01DRAFT_1083875 [Mycena amicta]
MPELPQEILEAILDHVHDRDTLRSCALVASCFLTRSQQRLFRSMDSMRISRDRPHRPPKQQRQTISSIFIVAPHLALYVRDLTVELSVHEDESAALDVILSAVQNLHGFAVNGQYTDWSNIAGGTARRIVECLKLPSLQQVRWQLLICVPLSVMETLLAVPIVSLDIVHMLRQDAIEPNERTVVPKLRDLSFMRDGGTISRFLLNPRNREYLRALKRMEIRLEAYDEQCVVLEACATTLETSSGLVRFQYFSSHPMIFRTAASPLIRIASLPSVRSIELTIFFVGNPQLPNTLLTIAESLESFLNLTTLSFTRTSALTNSPTAPTSKSSPLSTYSFRPDRRPLGEVFRYTVVCSIDVKEMLLRHKHEYRAEATKTYSHLKVDPLPSPYIRAPGIFYPDEIQKALLLNTLTEIELSDEDLVTITLFDANQWQPLSSRRYKPLEAIHTDTECVSNTAPVPTKDVLKAIPNAFRSRIHLDRSKHSIYTDSGLRRIGTRTLDPPNCPSMRLSDSTGVHLSSRPKPKTAVVPSTTRQRNGRSSGKTIVYVNPVAMANEADGYLQLFRPPSSTELEARHIVPNTLVSGLCGLDWAMILRLFAAFLVEYPTKAELKLGTREAAMAAQVGSEFSRGVEQTSRD